MFIKKRMGFTLVELMVVIVIIGILAALAIPRLTGASDKAKMSEAPGVIKSFESAYMAHISETGAAPAAAADLVFEEPQSKWFGYTASTTDIKAKAKNAIGKFAQGNQLISTYVPTPTTGAVAGKNCFQRTDDAAANVVSKMLPNWIIDPDCTP